MYEGNKPGKLLRSGIQQGWYPRQSLVFVEFSHSGNRMLQAQLRYDTDFLGEITIIAKMKNLTWIRDQRRKRQCSLFLAPVSRGRVFDLSLLTLVFCLFLPWLRLCLAYQPLFHVSFLENVAESENQKCSLAVFENRAVDVKSCLLTALKSERIPRVPTESWGVRWFNN